MSQTRRVRAPGLQQFRALSVLPRLRDHRASHSFSVGSGSLSLTAAKAGAVRMQELVRLHGSIENGLPYRLDVSGREDKCRVRHPVAAAVLGLFRRVTQAPGGPGPNVSASLEMALGPTFAAKMKNRLIHILRYLNVDLSRL